MELKSSPPLFARIMLGASALIVVGVAYWFLSQALEAVPVPPVAPPRKAQPFDPKADISKNPVFPLLLNDLKKELPDMPTGRDNPFIPVPTGSVMGQMPPEGGQIPGTTLKIVPVPTTTASGTVMTQPRSTTSSSDMTQDNGMMQYAMASSSAL